MLNDNQVTLDKFNSREKLLPILGKLLLLVFIVGFAYVAYFHKTPTSNVISKIEETGKFKASANARGGRNFCTIELKNGQLATLTCPSRLYFVNEEVRLNKVTNGTVIYYEVQDEVLNKLKP